MCWHWMKRLLCCCSHILKPHAAASVQHQPAAAETLGRNIYAQPQFPPWFLESADSR